MPKALQEQGLDNLVCAKLGLDAPAPDLASGTSSSSAPGRSSRTVEIALVGKYVKLHDAYLSVHEALKHAGIHNGCHVACAGSTPST